MSAATLIFYLLAAVAVVSAAGVVFARSPVHSAFFLVVSFLNVAGIYIMLGAEFLAAVQVIVYTGAILVLFLFVIMLVRPENLAQVYVAPPVQAILAWILGLALFFELTAVIATGVVTGQRSQYSTAQVAQFCNPGGLQQGQYTLEQVTQLCGNTQILGRVLYSDFLLPFEAASLVLLVAVVAAIVLGIPERIIAIGPLRHTSTISLGHPRGTDLIEAATRAHVPAVDAPDLDEPGVVDTERVVTAGTGRAGIATAGEGDERPGTEYDFRTERPKD
jgi:NADH-quinone oxidoreductase subunit J